MKKNYELVQVKVISLENDDIITLSATRSSTLLGQNFNLDGFDTQEFSYDD